MASFISFILPPFIPPLHYSEANTRLISLICKYLYVSPKDNDFFKKNNHNTIIILR